MKPSGRRSTDTVVGLQQVFIGFANFYRRFIQGFSKIATSLTAMLKTTGSSIASAFRVDHDEVVGGGDSAGAENGGSVVERKVGSIVCNHPEYPEDEKDIHPSLRPQRAGLITEKAPVKVPVEYVDFAFFPDLASELPEHTGIKDRSLELVDANGFIRPSMSPAGTPRQAGKGLILPKDFCWLTLAWVFTFSSADIRFASEGLTRLETTKRVELLNGGPRDDDKKPL